jgi:hypothetical protein
VALVRKGVFLRNLLRLLVTANVVSSSQILVALKMEAIRSSETTVLARVADNIPEDGILYNKVFFMYSHDYSVMER